MRTTKREVREARRAKKHYGLKKIKRNEKVAWLLKQYANGWAIGLAFNDHTRWLRGVRFATEQEAKAMIGGKCVCIHLKNELKK